MIIDIKSMKIHLPKLHPLILQEVGYRPVLKVALTNPSKTPFFRFLR